MLTYNTSNMKLLTSLKTLSTISVRGVLQVLSSSVISNTWEGAFMSTSASKQTPQNCVFWRIETSFNFQSTTLSYFFNSLSWFNGNVYLFLFSFNIGSAWNQVFLFWVIVLIYENWKLSVLFIAYVCFNRKYCLEVYSNF